MLTRKTHDASKKYSFMPPAYYAKGFSILPVYKKTFDYTEMRKLYFLENPDPKMVAKWGHLRSRLPLPETRVTNLPGTRDLYEKSMEKVPLDVSKKMKKDENEDQEEVKICVCKNAECPKKKSCST